MVVAPAVTCSGLLLASRVVVWVAGEQLGVPPLSGTKASARTPNKIFPVAGGVKETTPPEKVPTCGLLAGTTRVYCGQLGLAGEPVGQVGLSVKEILSGEPVFVGMAM